MVKIKEISSAELGVVKVVYHDGEALFCLKDVAKLLGIKYQDALVGLSQLGMKDIPVQLDDGKNKVMRVFVTSDNFAVLHSKSTRLEADAIIDWLYRESLVAGSVIGEYAIDDLKDESKAKEVLDQLVELRVRISVQDLTLKANEHRIRFIETLTGTARCYDLAEIPDIIKYRGITLRTLLQDLRTAGVFDSDNMPNTQYIDNHCFRKVTAETSEGAQLKRIQRVYVYQGGLRLIEDILKKKASGKNAKEVR